MKLTVILTVTAALALYLLLVLDDRLTERRAKRLHLDAERARADKFSQSSHVRIIPQEGPHGRHH